MFTEQIDLARIQRAVELTDLAALARRAGVPYTTLRSFAKRGWNYKHSQMLARLARAADEILAQTPAQRESDKQARLARRGRRPARALPRPTRSQRSEQQPEDG